MEEMSSHYDGGARESGNGVEVSAKRHRDFVDEHLTHHAAADVKSVIVALYRTAEFLNETLD